MKPEISDKLDVDKISETLGVKWQHQLIEDYCFDKPELITLENTYLFSLFEHDFLRIRLYIISNVPKEVQILINLENSSRSIRFQDISRVLYNPKLRLIIFESKGSDFYSQLRIEHDGRFDLSISNPVSNYKNSWLTFMCENLGLIEFKPE